jgi:putative transposase
MLLKNDVFDAKDETRYRVLAVVDSPNRGWVFPFDGPYQWPIYRDFGVLTGHAEPKPIRTRSPTGLPDKAFFSKAARDRAEAAFKLIKPLLANPQIFEESSRGRLVAARAEEVNVSKTTLYRYLRMYWRNGQNLLALMNDFDKIGRTRTGITAGRGRRPKDGKYTTFQMKAVDIENIEKAVRTHYLNGEISTLAGAHFQMRQDNYCYVDGNGDRYLLPDGEFPSIFQFRHIASTRFTLEDILRKKRGKKEFDREHGPHLGSALEECLGVGHIYEIDATIADVFLVAIADRTSIIGKPTLYLIYDRWSRLIVGFYVGLENASWTGAMLAILSIAADKQALCARYSVPYNAHDWVADATFPQKFVGDRGEMASHDSYRICDGMETTVTNTQSLLPHRKGTVECGFKLIHASIADVTPGYEPPLNAVKRRAVRYFNDASLTLEEFTSIILQSIIAHNRRLMTGYEPSPQQVLDEVPSIPLELWNDDIARRSGSLARYDYDFLHLQLLPRDEATVTQDGIMFRKCVYKLPETHGSEWFVTAGKRGNFKVQCSFDHRLVDSIIVYNPKDPREAIVCPLGEKSDKYAGYSFAEVEYIVRKKEFVDFGHKHSADQARAELRNHVRSISGPAVAQTRIAAKGKSRSGRRADTAAAREAERAAMRRQEGRLPLVFETSSSNVIAMPSRPADAASPLSAAQLQIEADQPTRAPQTSIQALLRRKAQEKLNEQQN